MYGYFYVNKSQSASLKNVQRRQEVYVWQNTEAHSRNQVAVEKK